MIRPFRQKIAVSCLAIALCLACGRIETDPLPPTFELPRPDLSGVEQSVADQIEVRLAEVEAQPTGASAAERAWAIGSLGRLYHAYDFAKAAETCYRESGRLAPGEYSWPYYLGFLGQVRGDWEEAERWFEEALALRPGDPATRLRLAAVRLEAGKMAAAERDYAEILAADGENPAAREAAGRLAILRGDHRLAIEHLEAALTAQPSADALHYQLAQAYRALGSEREAERHLLASGTAPVTFADPLIAELDREASGAASRLARAGVALAQGRPELAVAEYRRAVVAAPEDPSARLNLGVLLASSGETAEAEEHLRAAVRLDPEGVSGHHALGRLLTEGRDHAEARTHLERAVEIDPRSEAAWFHLGELELAAGDPRTAAEAFSRVLQLNPQAAAARLGRARSNLAVDLVASATEDLRRLTEADPEDATAQLFLGEALQRAGDRVAARAAYRAAATGELEPNRRAVAWLGAGNLELELGDRAGAREALVRAVSLAPDLVAAHFNLAGLEAGDGDLEAARRRYARVLDLEPANTAARFYLGESLFRLGRFAESRSVFETLLAAEEGHEGAHEGRAAAFAGEGRHLEARRALERGLAAVPESSRLAAGLARVLASCPDESVRDGETATRLALRLMAAEKSLENAETLAMALAQTGRHDQAIEWQREVIRQATGAQLGDERLARLRAELERYKRGLACCAEPASLTGRR